VPLGHGGTPKLLTVRTGSFAGSRIALVLGGVLALAGCGAASERPAGGPAVRSAASVSADVERYADQTAVLMHSSLTNPTLNTTPCAGGLFSVQGVYRIPLWITRHPKARATLRDVWTANKLPITLDSTVDGYLGAISTVTPDGYTIDVVSITPKPTALSLQVRSPCVRAS
jgi:hypothetical protein